MNIRIFLKSHCWIIFRHIITGLTRARLLHFNDSSYKIMQILNSMKIVIDIHEYKKSLNNYFFDTDWPVLADSSYGYHLALYSSAGSQCSLIFRSTHSVAWVVPGIKFIKPECKQNIRETIHNSSVCHMWLLSNRTHPKIILIKSTR